MKMKSMKSNENLSMRCNLKMFERGMRSRRAQPTGRKEVKPLSQNILHWVAHVIAPWFPTPTCPLDKTWLSSDDSTTIVIYHWFAILLWYYTAILQYYYPISPLPTILQYTILLTLLTTLHSPLTIIFLLPATCSLQTTHDSGLTRVRPSASRL